MTDTLKAQPASKAQLRDEILSRPELILEDSDIMSALAAANQRDMGGNVIDLRGLAMDRLEDRLGQLETTHRSVVAAAYDNLAGTTTIQTAILRLLEPTDLSEFLTLIGTELKILLRVDGIRLVLESPDHARKAPGFEDVLSLVQPGVVEYFVTAGKPMPAQTVTLRQVAPASEDVYGALAPEIGSEALLTLDMGTARLPGLLVLGARDPDQFRPGQGTDLLTFFTGAFERVLRRLLD